MSETAWALNDPEAVQRWSEALTYESEVKAYFNKFEGTGEDSLIVVKDELNKGAGEKVTFSIAMKLSEDGVEGDDTIEGHATGEEAIDTFTDSLYIDQKRKGTLSKGKMSEQRVPWAMRDLCKKQLTSWWVEHRDQIYFMYLAGSRGINPDFHFALDFTGRANNSLQAPNADNLVYGGDATSKADIDATDLMSLSMVERLVAKAETQDPMIQPFMIDGEKKYVLLMHTFQAFAMRTNTSENDWLAIQKAAQRGNEAMFYKNSLGEYADVVMHKHRSVIRFSDYGSGGDVAAARALFLGAQAATCAYGRNNSSADLKNRRFSWHEETADRGNKLAVTSGQIFGTKKTRYNGKDFGVFAVDTACVDPNA